MVRRQRLTEEFVRHHRWLRERTGDMPTALATVLEQQPDLALSIRELDLIWSVLDRHRRTSKARFVVQAHPEFSNAMRDYEERWRDSYGTLLNWEHHRETGQSLSDWFDEVLDEASRSTSVEGNGDEEWDFDPDLHSASAHVEGIADYIEGKANDAPFFSRAAQSFRWLKESVGIDLITMEARWREFPVLIIPEQVSNKHGLQEPRSLFAYLKNVRLAYMMEADLAALGMCRTCTEILLRVHYMADSTTRLGRLIEAAQAKDEFAFLRPFNLGEKVRHANQIIHAGAADIGSLDDARALIRAWVPVLKDMIERAPHSQE